MAATVDSSRSVGPQAGPPWRWPFWSSNGSSRTMDRVPASSSSTMSDSESPLENYRRSVSANSTSTSSAESDSSSDNYSRSSSANSFPFGKHYVPNKSEMKRVFEKFDENKDGKICGKDLHRFMGRLGMDMSVEEAKSMLKSVDHNSDGCVDFEEFYSLYLSFTGDILAMEEVAEEVEEEDETLLQVFQVFDRNGDGRISADELQDVLNQLGIPEGEDISNCRQMIQRVDSNGDELIDIEEFKSMMRCSSCFEDY
ncbi:unnamed protein product [Calypogeia fissa]